jgi:large subunit ribosomal protein L17
MGKKPARAKLSRDKDHRKALFRNLISALIMRERIKTTEAKAKAIKGLVDRLVSNAKDKGVRRKDKIANFLTSNSAANKLYKDILPRFKERSSGFTRIVKIGRRRGDNAQMVFMEWVKKSSKVKSQKSKSGRNTEKKSKK